MLIKFSNKHHSRSSWQLQDKAHYGKMGILHCLATTPTLSYALCTRTLKDTRNCHLKQEGSLPF